jgi:hypothetical protein
VNGSPAVIERCPNVCLYGEIEAALHHAGAIHSYAAIGVAVWARPTAKAALLDKLPSPVIRDGVRTVPLDFGPAKLRHLHSDTPMPGGERQPWISSGLLLLWVLAEVYKPRRIVVCGAADGYPVDPTATPRNDARQGTAHNLPGEYAPGITPLPSRPLRSSTWAAAMNRVMQRAAGEITRHYTATEFHWRRRPAIWADDWRATCGGVRV